MFCVQNTAVVEPGLGRTIYHIKLDPGAAVLIIKSTSTALTYIRLFSIFTERYKSEPFSHAAELPQSVG